MPPGRNPFPDRPDVGAPTVFVSAGEPSGDAHAAAFVGALREAVPGVRVEGLGGAHLAAAGAELMARIEDLTVMGFVEVLAKVPAHARLLRRMRERFARGDVGLVVLVDYPGFHLHVAAAAREAGIPVLYYIAPQLWAWAERRVRKLRERVTRLAVILPFEEAFFRGHGVEATFVGHPLLDRPPAAESRAAAARALGLDPARPVLSIFPGSRRQEVRRLWPVFRAAAERVRTAHPALQVVVAGTGVGEYPGAGALTVVPSGRPSASPPRTPPSASRARRPSRPRSPGSRWSSPTGCTPSRTRWRARSPDCAGLGS